MFDRKLLGFAAILIACVFTTYAISQDKKGDDKVKPSGGIDPTMMQQMIDAGKPGPHHKAMEAMAGDFKYVNKWKMDPSMDWMTATGEYHADMQCGGRYLFTHVSGPMMGDNFEGFGCLGYDNLLKKHVSAWIDNMGTGIMRSEGSCSDDCKTLDFSGEMLDMMTKKMAPYKYEFKIKDNDHFSMTWWAPDQTGKMFESMVIEYTRSK